VIIDTDVLIWFLRGDDKAKEVIYANTPFKISAVSYIELLQGMRNKAELSALKKYLDTAKTQIIHINENISLRAMGLIENYFLSHSLELADAFIASTALEIGEPILTSNNKHYKFIPNIEISVFSREIFN
jgi:predicted nucleic acid-binding protein